MDNIRVKSNVLYVEASCVGTIGGSHHSLLFLLREIDKSRYTPHVVFYERNNLLSQYQQITENIHILSPTSSFRLLGEPPNSLAFLNPIRRKVNSFVNFFVSVVLPAVKRARWLKRQRIDLVHLNNNPYLSDWVLGCKLAGIPCVAHYRGLRKRTERLSVAVASRVDRIICISQAVYDVLRSSGCKVEQLRLIHNGIDPEYFKPSSSADKFRSKIHINQNDFVIGIVGNIKEWKGQMIFVQSMIRVFRNHHHVTALLVGGVSDADQGHYAEIKERIKEKGLEERIRFTGYTDVVADYVNVMDLVVHASVAPEPLGVFLSRPWFLENR
jgi:glycosyltransferase involved in cell wall biosynthesis